jgi:hypothetical protein
MNLPKKLGKPAKKPTGYITSREQLSSCVAIGLVFSNQLISNRTVKESNSSYLPVIKISDCILITILLHPENH